ncbi:MAG: FAD-dependent oxidoreductase [Pseudomonadota bacterium]
MTTSFPRLFSPIAIGAREARNRIMRTATTSNLAEKQRVSNRLIEFYRTLAKGGVGSIVTESVAVHPSYTGGQGTLQLYDPGGLPGLERLTEAVRAEGALFFCQLRHGGRQHHARQIPTLWAPSAIQCPHSGTIPHEMTEAEIREVIDGFVISAIHSKRAGFDGVEIQGGHGHLIQEFISGFSNRREDAYGGSYDKRLKFARDIIQEVRAAVGRDFIVGYRLGVEEFTPGGITIDESLRTAAEFAAGGEIDFMSLTQGNFNSIETHLPDRRFPINTYVASHHARIHEAVRRVSDIPVISTGRIRSPADAEAILEAGHAEIVGMCRQLIADPELPNKARDGRLAEIRRCTNGNHCWSKIRSGDPLGCELNPVAGREVEWGAMAPADRKRRILVVGGGPAGLEAARVAAERGHEVTLIERGAALGGKLTTLTGAVGFAELAEHVGATVAILERQGVQVRLGIEVTSAVIAEAQPDAVVIATGAEAMVPSVDSDGSVPLLLSIRDLSDDQGDRRTVVVVDDDGDNWACFETEQAAGRGHRTILATRFFEVLRDLPIVTRITALKRLDEMNVELMPNIEFSRIERGGGRVPASLHRPRDPDRRSRRGGVGRLSTRQRCPGGRAARGRCS